MLDIDKSLTSFQLSQRLYQLKCSEPDSLLLDLLCKLTKKRLLSSDLFEEIQLEEIQLEEIRLKDEKLPRSGISEDTENVELLARWCDLMQYLKINVFENCCSAYEFYMQAYNQTKQWPYAFRAFYIVKIKRGAFKGKINEIKDDSISVLKDLNYSEPYKKIVDVLSSIFNKEDMSHYASDINLKLQDCLDHKKYRDALFFVGSLNSIRIINTEECRKQESLILEQDADNIVANKKENTFYQSIVPLYNEALCKIADLEGCKEEKQRLSRKLLAEQEQVARAMQVIGQNTEQIINLQEIYDHVVFRCKINNSLSAYKAMISFPIISNSCISLHREDSKKNYSFLYENFGRHIQINDKGATVRIKEGDQAIENSIRRHAMLVLIEYLKIFIHIMYYSGNCNVDEKFIYERLLRLKSRFIPKDRMILFVQGLYLGFKGDFSLAAHILLPQVENSFRYIAQQHEITTTRLTDGIQHENTMGGVLEKIKPHTKVDVWEELNHFLVDGIGFRNEVMHGLSSHGQNYQYGIYLWWLCLKIIYNTDEYFGFKKSISKS